MALPTASDNKFPKLILAETSAPSSPAASHRSLYVDSNHVLRWKDSAGTDSPLVALNKWTATAAPTANDDSGDGYSVGSRWIDTTNDKEYVCLDATAAAAVWTETTASGGGSSSLASAKYTRTSADYSTSSSTFTDVDATNLALAITTGARRVLVSLTAAGYQTSSSDYICLDVDLDGTRMVGGTYGLLIRGPAASEPTNCSFTIISDVLTAASHTFKLQYRRGSTGTVTLYGGSGTHLIFAVHELPS